MLPRLREVDRKKDKSVSLFYFVINMKRIQKRSFFDYTWKRNPNAVYIGRGSRWGSPFKLQEYDRETALGMYRLWLRYQLIINPNFLEPLRDKDLVCFCSLEEKCHGDIIIEYFKNSKI